MCACIFYVDIWPFSLWDYSIFKNAQKYINKWILNLDCEQKIANIFNLGLYGVVFFVVICLLLFFLLGENGERTAKKLILTFP